MKKTILVLFTLLVLVVPVADAHFWGLFHNHTTPQQVDPDSCVAGVTNVTQSWCDANCNVECMSNLAYSTPCLVAGTPVEGTGCCSRMTCGWPSPIAENLTPDIPADDECIVTEVSVP